MVGGCTRITPADAGKTRYPRRRNRNRQDHPRGCGENFQPNHSCFKRNGSPPRMRGKLCFRGFRNASVGITPADAGKTSTRKLLCAGMQDHPRGCGENLLPCHRRGGHMGSPPRMRGKLARKIAGYARSRITPADAGKTLKRSFRNQPFCSRAVQISFNFSNSLNVSLQSGSAR